MTIFTMSVGAAEDKHGDRSRNDARWLAPLPVSDNMLHMRNSVIILLFAFGLAVAGLAAEVGQSQSPAAVLRASGFLTGDIGIAGPSTDPDLSAMKAAGFRYVRTDLKWNQIENARGIYDWREADRRLGAMQSRGLRPILILDYSNPLFTPAISGARTHWMAPRDPRAIGAFATWAAAAAKRYARFQPIWELWNEPDSDGFWPPKADSGGYLALAQSSCAAIRGADPRATIWGPALSWAHHDPANSPFLKAVLASSLPSCLSAISVHPYATWAGIDTAPEYWSGLRAMPMRVARPFVSSESGISNFQGQFGASATGATQASYLVRMFIYDHMQHLPVSIWYNWRDDGRDPTEKEQNFGLLDFSGKPKPAFVALEALIKQTNGFDRECLVRNNSRALLYAWRQNLPDQLVLVAWSTSQAMHGLNTNPAGEIDVDLPGMKGAPNAADLYGQKANAQQTGPENWRIDGGGQPYYIHYTGRIPARCA